MTSQQPVKLVYFYSGKDRFLVDRVKNNLKILQNRGCVELWCSRDPDGGQENLTALKNSLENAQIVLYFLSSEFFTSDDINIHHRDYLNLKKTQTAAGQSLEDWVLDRHHAGKLRIVPILLHDSTAFDESSYSRLSVLPEGKSLGSYRVAADQKNVCAKIGETIRGIAEEIRKGKTVTDPINGPVRKIPPFPVSLLPQLCRSEQEKDLKELFSGFRNEHMPNYKKTPLFCVVHGDTNELPQLFRERIEERDIYEFLGIDYEAPIQIYNLKFPFRKSNVDAPLVFFEKSLSEKFFDGIDSKTKDESFKFINHFRTIIIDYEAYSEIWDENVMQAFLEFWNSFSGRETQTTLIVNLSFFYDENDIERSLKARSFFSELKENHFSPYENLNGKILTELEALERGEVYEWLDSEKTFYNICSKHLKEFCDVESVRYKISDLYDERQKVQHRFVRNEKVLVRMRTLSEKLGEVLAKKRCRF